MKEYTTKQAIENYTLQTIAPSFDEQIEAWIEAMENFIDKYTGRNFKADAEASEKLFDGEGEKNLLVDDFMMDEGDEVILKIDDVEIDAEDYFLYPANGTTKNKIVLENNIFTYGQQNISVEARWGYTEEVPADIKLATTILVAGIISYADGSKGKVRSESVGRYSVSYSDNKGWDDFDRVMGILKSYKKFNLG